METMKDSFNAASAQALNQSNKTFMHIAQEKFTAQSKQNESTLDSKKQLIDQQLNTMSTELGKVEQLIQDIGTERKTQYGALDDQLKQLNQTSSLLQNALADNRSRGQWGERIADDILRISGLIEGVNYSRQDTTKSNTRPDFTFYLPNDKSLNMDSKFPLDNYIKHLEAEADVDKQKFQKAFLTDVKNRVKEIQRRGYISPETVDCVLIFIPNEQVYRYIHEKDNEIIELALEQKVVLCSPLTLYIVLSVIRQAAENFALDQSSREILDILTSIKAEWGKYTKGVTDLGKHLEKAKDAYDALVVTRTRALDRKFASIDEVVNNYRLTSTVNNDEG